MPTGDEEVIVFYDKDNLVALLDFLLEHNDIREKIAKNGQKAVLDKHTFQHRCLEMLEIIGGDIDGGKEEESKEAIKKEE
jgi:spore maturation protein CgeB